MVITLRPHDTGRKESIRLELAFVFASALAFYGATLAPTVTWGDSAWLAVNSYYGRLSIGNAGDHPLFVWIGYLLSALPVEIARLVNFEAALFGALAVTMVYRCGRQLGTGRLAAGVGAAALCVSHVFWLHSVVAEVYTANAFFLAAILSLLIDWNRERRGYYLAAAVGVFTIGLTNHLVLASVAPAAIVFVAATNPRLFLTRRFALSLAGIAAALVGVAIAAPPSVAAALMKLWTGPPGISEYFRVTIEPGPTAREAAYYLLYLIYQFPSVSLLLGFVGMWVLVRDRRSVAGLLLMTVAVNAGIFIHHTDWQSASKVVFYIADYVVFALLCAVGTEALLRRLASRVGPDRSRVWGTVILAAVALLPPVIYAVVPTVTRQLGVELVQASPLPYRDNQRYFLNPNKHGEDGAKRFASEALQVVAPAAVIFADFTPGAVLGYIQMVDKVRPDVRLVYSSGPPIRVHWMFDGERRRPTYLARLRPDDYDLSGLTGEYDLVAAGPLVEVRPRF